MQTIHNRPLIPYEQIAALEASYRHMFFLLLDDLPALFEQYKVFEDNTLLTDVSELKEPYDDKRLERFEIPDYSEVKWLYNLSARQGEEIYIQSVHQVLLCDGWLLIPPYYSKPNEPLSFSLFDNRDINCKLRHFEYDKPEPNRVGKVTVKKLKAWVDYLVARQAAAMQYIDEMERKDRKLMQRIVDAGLEYERDGDKVKIHNGPLCVEAQIDEDVIHHGLLRVDPDYLYGQVFGRGINALDFILNNIITVTPREK